MEKQASATAAGGSAVYNTVFIDTSLDTHLAMIISDSDTVSDLKKRILHEHPQCFPNIGAIKINALKVKRRGYLYHLSDSMFVKSAFDGVSKNWFLSVDASSSEERCGNDNSLKPGTGDVVACLDIRTNNSSADMVNLLLEGPSKRLSNINESSLPQDADNHHAKHNSASEQFDIGNSAKGNSKDLLMEVDHADLSNSKGSFPPTNKKSRPKVQDKDVGDNIVCEDIPASVSASVIKEKHNVRKRKKEIGASAVESGKEALGSEKVNEKGMVLNDKKLGNHISVDETFKTVSTERNNKSVSGKRVVDEGAEVPGEHSEHQPNKRKDVSLSEQVTKLTENSSQPEPVSKKKRKFEKKDGNKNSLVENSGLISELDKPGSGPDITTSEHSVGQKLGSKSAISDQLTTESAEARGRKKSKRQKTSPIQVASEISFAKDVEGGTNQTMETISENELGSEADQGNVLGAVSEFHRISSKEMHEVSRTYRMPHSGGDDDMADINEGNIESKAPESDVASVMKTGDSIDLNASCQPTIVSQEKINPQNSVGVSGHENQSGKSETKSAEPKKSSKKTKQSKKTMHPIGGTKALEAEADPDASATKARDSVGQNSNHMGSHPTLVSQEGNNLPNGIVVSGDENNNVKLGDEIVEPKKSSRKTKKPKTTKDTVGGTEALDARRDDGTYPASDMMSLERPNSVTGDHLSDNAEQDGKTPGKEASKLKTTELLPSLTDKRAGPDVSSATKTRDSVDQNSNHVGGHPTRVSQEGINLPNGIGVSGDENNNVTLGDEIVEPKKSSRKPKKPKRTKDTVGATEALDARRDDGTHPASDMMSLERPTSVTGDHLSNYAEQDGKTPGKEASKLKTTELLPSVIDNRADDVIRDVLDSLQQCNNSPANTENMEKKKKKTKKKSSTVAHAPEMQGKDDVDHGNPAVPSDNVSEMSASSKSTRKTKVANSNSAAQLNRSGLESKNNSGVGISPIHTQLDPSSSIQSQRSSSKVERRNTNVQSSKTHLTGSESVAKKHLQSKKSDKTNSTKEAQRSIGINSSSSTIERSKSTIIFNKGGNEGRSHLVVSKASGSSNGKVLNSLGNKKSLLATAGTIFKHDDKESSDDEDGVDNSDDSTRTPSDNLSSDDDSETNISSSRNGSYKSGVEDGDGRNRKEPGSSSPKTLSMQAILRGSSSYKKAKLTASQSQHDDLDSQLEEFVPDSQAYSSKMVFLRY